MTELQRLWIRQLLKEHEQICYQYSLKLSRPVIQIVAQSSFLGRWDSLTSTLSLSQSLIETYTWDSVVEIFKHEMIHQLLSEHYEAEVGHGPLFQSWCERIRIAPWAQRATVDTSKLLTRDESQSHPMLSKIEKLLSLATSDNPHEAETAMAMAQSLLEKYNLSLNPSRKTFISRVIVFRKQRTPRHTLSIAHLLQAHFFVETLFTDLFDAASGKSSKALELMGTPENVEVASYAFSFLENNLAVLWNRHKAQQDLKGHKRDSFYLGVIKGFKEKLEKQEEQSRSSLPATQLIILKNDPQLKAFLAARYPKLTQKRLGRKRIEKNLYEAGVEQGRHLIFKRGLEASERSHRALPSSTRR